MTLNHKKNKLKDCKKTYARVCVSYRPNKKLIKMRITCRRNLVDYPDEVMAKTAHLVTSKIF